MTKNDILSMLQNNPADLLREIGIFVEQETNDPLAFLGGQREIDFSELKSTNKIDKVFKFSLHSGKYECYYYPFLSRFTDNSIPGSYLDVGHCLVPIDAPIGTIVLTGGLNGCAIQVNKTEDSKYLIFMHDKNSNSMDTPEKQSVLLSYMKNFNKEVAFPNDLNDYILRIDFASYSQEFDNIIANIDYSKNEYPVFLPITIKTSEKRWEIFMCELKIVRPSQSKQTYEAIKDVSGNNRYLKYSFDV